MNENAVSPMDTFIGAAAAVVDEKGELSLAQKQTEIAKMVATKLLEDPRIKNKLRGNALEKFLADTIGVFIAARAETLSEGDLLIIKVPESVGPSMVEVVAKSAADALRGHNLTGLMLPEIAVPTFIGDVDSIVESLIIRRLSTEFGIENISEIIETDDPGGELAKAIRASVVEEV